MEKLGVIKGKSNLPTFGEAKDKFGKLGMLGGIMLAASLQLSGDTIDPVEFDWTVPVEKVNKLFLKPVLSFEGTLGELFGTPMQVKTNKRMFFLGHMRKILQANDNCEFTPKGQALMTNREISVRRLKINMEQCADEFFDSCLEEAMGDELDIFDWSKSEHLTKLRAAMVTIIVRAIKEDIFMLANFGDKTSSDDFYGLMDGIWTIFDKEITAGNITEVSAGSGSALSLGDSIVILEALHTNSSRLLRRTKKSQRIYYVTETIYEDYRKVLQSVYGTNETAYQYMINGVPEGLMYNGIPVVPFAEWDMALEEDFGLSNQHRAIYTVKGNIRLGSDMRGKSPALRIYLDPVHKKTWFFDAAFKLGTQYAHNELVTIAR